MAGRPPEIQRGSEQWEHLKGWVLPSPRGLGLEAKAAHGKAQEQGWSCSYHTIYRTRRLILAEDQDPPVASAPTPGPQQRKGLEAQFNPVVRLEPLAPLPEPLPKILSEQPRHCGRFAMRSDLW